MISANTEQINVPVLPVGMAGVAASVQQAGHEVKILNLMSSGHVKGFFDDALTGFRPDVIGISVRNIDDQNMASPQFLLPPVKTVIEHCRRLSGSPIVLGGAGYSIFPQAGLKYLGADLGIKGEGEHAFCRVLERLEKCRPVLDVPGVVPGPGKEPRMPERIKRLDDFPLPGAGLHLNIPEDIDRDQVWVPFQSRRGCPMNCSYCSTPAIEGRLMRRRSVASVVSGLKEYEKAGFRRFFFVDNIFNMPAGYAESLCDGIIESEMDIAWQAIVYPLGISSRLAGKMVRAGCTGVSLGFESGSPEILSGMNKRFSPEDIAAAADVLGRHGIFRTGFLLMGGPGETRDTVCRSVEFAESLNLESMKLTAGIRIYPETRLAEQARSRGIIDPGSDLLYPAFYLEPSLDGWLQDLAASLVSQKENWHM
ncbi:MAG: radical SAM protein [Desulfobacteraceae bacterium]|nr:radical SAM protein [Desulfobacteraceae bacterium]